MSGFGGQSAYGFGGGGSGGGITGGGTVDFLAKFTPTGASIGDSQIYDDGSFVGIGTTTQSASELLNVSGDTILDGTTRLLTGGGIWRASGNVDSLNVEARQLLSANGIISIEYGTRTARDSTNVSSITWNDRSLRSTGGGVVLSWGNSRMDGSWRASGKFTVGANPIFPAQLYIKSDLATDPLRIDTDAQANAFSVIDGTGALKSYLMVNGNRAISFQYNNFNNTFVGFNAGTLTATSENNVAVGSSALGSLGAGFQSVAIGNSALQSIVDSGGCVAVGYLAQLSTTAGDNTSVGANTLQGNTTGASNTALGRNAGFTGNGSNNVYLGLEAGYFETGSAKLFIDNNKRANEADARVKALVYGIFDGSVANQRFSINANVGIAGQATATSTLNISGLPVSSAGLVSGDVWNNSGVLNIV